LVLELFSPESLDGIDFASPKVLGIEWSDGEIPEATSAKVLGDKWLAGCTSRPEATAGEVSSEWLAVWGGLPKTTSAKVLGGELLAVLKPLC
jgi:hypothetical protein